MYRKLVSQENVDAWVAIVGVASLLFAGVYCFALRNTRRTTYNPVSLAHWAKYNLPSWRAMVLLAGFAFWGRIYGQDFGYWINGLSLYMIRIAIVTSSVALVCKFGSRILLLTLLVQTLHFEFARLQYRRCHQQHSPAVHRGKAGLPIRWRQIMLLGGPGCFSDGIALIGARIASGRLGGRADSGICLPRALADERSRCHDESNKR